MRILHLSTHDIKGGAARAAHRLHSGLLRQGHESVMLVAHRASRDPAVIALQRPLDLASRLRRRWRRERITRGAAPYRTMRPRGHELFSDDRGEHGTALVDQLPPRDVINLHWIADFVDYRTFFAAVPEHIPLVWTLHDMSPFTGGCHYDRGCGRFAAQCGACPQLGSHREGDLSRQVWRRKQAAFVSITPERLHLVTPSRWLAGETQRSSLMGRFPVTVIPNGIDTDDFTPRDRTAARAALGLPPEAQALLFVADQMGESRKGFALLVEALRGLGEARDLQLISIGGSDPALDLPIPHLHLGRIEQDRLLSLVYSAVDLFVLPSLQDNLPNTVLEALACGTPVVGFDACGIPDMVRPGITGSLAPAGDVSGLRAAITQLLGDATTRAAMSANCRRIAVEEYTLDMQARRYLELYAALLDQAARGR